MEASEGSMEALEGGRERLRSVRSRRCVLRALRGDRGSGTVWMVALIGAVWAVATMVMVVGGARVARQRAHAAADLAALAAAAHIAEGTGRACGLAARVARDSGGWLRRCTVRGRIVDVIVTSHLRAFAGAGRLTATARARAGPADDEPVPDPVSGLPVPGVTRRTSAR